MTKKLNDREWVEKQEQHLRNPEIIDLINIPDLEVTEIKSWTFLKLAFLWSFAYHLYTPIAGNHYKNLYYVDLFSGSGLVSPKDNPNQHILGSPVLMATLANKYPFKKCYFFEKEFHHALQTRLGTLENNGKLSCEDYEVFSDDCNLVADGLIDELKTMQNAHFLLFVDPWSTQINWETMEKLLSLKYPAFDMIFNFQSFGVNRKSHNPELMCQFFGDEGYKSCLKITSGKPKFEALKKYYIQKLKQFDSINTVYNIKVSSGNGFYYDLLYTTRKENPKWKGGIKHLAKMIGHLSGRDVAVILDPNASSLDDFF